MIDAILAIKNSVKAASKASSNSSFSSTLLDGYSLMFKFRHECGSVHAKTLVLDGMDWTDQIADNHINIGKGILLKVDFEFD